MTTHMPELALLVLSLALVGLSIYTAWDTAATPIEIKGAAAAVDEEVKVLFKSQWPVPVAGRQASQVLRPQLEAIMRTSSTPPPATSPFTSAISSGISAN